MIFIDIPRKRRNEANSVVVKKKKLHKRRKILQVQPPIPFFFASTIGCITIHPRDSLFPLHSLWSSQLGIIKDWTLETSLFVE
nr:unnamed protein product [Spirometra erinaceieuropaei]